MKPYRVFRFRGSLVIVLLRPDAIKRCSVEELAEQLRPLQSREGRVSWRTIPVVPVRWAMIPVALERDRRVRTVVSAAFAPRSSSTAWKDA